MFRRHPYLSLTTFAYLGFVGWVTLGPQPFGHNDSALIWRALRFFGRHDATDWITYQRLEFLANVGMFIPVGMFFLLLFGRRMWFAAVFAGVAMTFSIEFVQIFLPDRVSDVSDIISNSLGTLIGVVFTLVVTTGKAMRLRREARQSELAGSRR